MNKTYFTQLSAYNQWANHIVCEWLKSLSDESWKQTIVSSFNSIEQTTVHIIGAEQIWLQRLQQDPEPVWYPLHFKGSREEAVSDWHSASVKLHHFVEALNESDLVTPLSYKRINGEEYTMEIYKILAHIFNHSTYHRGQLITQLRQAGFEEVTTTDLLAYYNMHF